ncbi:MAG: HDOD domain-containing protein [Terracidiphilus sp.]|jgi:EAL and modified HD-GYP domain-containing signal transduction protein
MAVQTPPVHPNKSLRDIAHNSLQGKGSQTHYVVRLPILDPMSNVHAYELLFWDGQELTMGWKNELATHAVFSNAMVFGIEELASGKPAFVQCTPQALTAEWIWNLPPNLTVVVLLEDSRLSQGQLDACARLKDLGFRFALDEFTRKPGAHPLLDLANYVMVDLARIPPTERRYMRAMLDGVTACPIAKNVESQEEYREAWGAGFRLFQGLYFCRPEPVRDHQIPANRILHIEILEALQNDSIDLNRLSRLIMRDASLTYSLLRLANSPLISMRYEVTSVHSALMQLGEDRTRRIAMLAIATDFDAGEPPELLRMAFERARFCELGAELLGLSPKEQYLIGMASMFPSMLRMTVENLVSLMPLREAARDALLGRECREGILLNVMTCQDRRDWAALDALVKAHELRVADLMWRCSDARDWANTTIQAMK